VASQRDWASPPTFTPAPYRLVDAVDGPHPFAGHQKLGVMFQPDDCSLPLETTAECVSGIGALKEPTGDLSFRGADPFVLYTWIDCGLVGVGYDELRKRTLRAHDNNAQIVAEQVFWTGGLFTTSPHLASDDVITEVVGGSTVNLQTAATVVVTGAVDVTKAISLLEGAMAGCYGGTPIIHVPRSVTAFLSKDHLVTAKGSRLVTDNGSIVVPGLGYPGTAPDGSEPAADTVWIYATGSVKMWQSAVNFTSKSAKEMLGRSVNDTFLIAEQWFMFGWDCCHFAVQVELPNTSTS
jgi:hypothetical protein